MRGLNQEGEDQGCEDFAPFYFFSNIGSFYFIILKNTYIKGDFKMKYAFDFTKINSITSILTYHQLGQKGRLQEDRIDTSIFADDEVVNLYI